jgi:hypothetical protein
MFDYDYLLLDIDFDLNEINLDLIDVVVMYVHLLNHHLFLHQLRFVRNVLVELIDDESHVESDVEDYY